MTGNHSFGVISVLEADKESGRRQESPAFKCNLWLIVLSLQESLEDMKFPSCTEDMTLPIKAT